MVTKGYNRKGARKMVNDWGNLLRWERKMTAMECRILVTNLVARASYYILGGERDA